MTVTFVPKLTQELILNHVSEEEIFEAFGVPVVTSSFCSPLRADKHPTCRFYRRRSNHKLIMRDLAGHFWGDCFDLVQKVTRKGYYDAMKEIAIKFNLIDGDQAIIYREPAKPKVIIQSLECEIRIKRMEWTEAHLAYWKQYHISKETLDFMRVSPIEQAWLNDESVFWYGKRKEIAFCYHFGGYDYKLYFPTRGHGEVRFCHNDPNILQGWHQLPKKHPYLVITKSLKDVMALYEFNIPAIAPMTETQVITELTRDQLLGRFDQLFCLYDCDMTGVHSMQKMKKMGITPLFFKRSQPKDFADFLKKYGKEDAALVVDYYQSIFS